MSAIRVTAMLCITVLVIITGVMVHSNSQDRYIILPQNNAMFIFDRKTSAVNYCTADQCRLVMPYGSASMPGMPGMPGMGGANIPGMMMSGMPQGFQPYVSPGVAPGGDNSGMLLSTSMMNNPTMPAGNNNPMMMWAYMQAASSASASAQKGGFSSLQSQPSWMNMMAMMQPTAASNSVVSAQSPIVPTAMEVALPDEKKKTKKPNRNPVDASSDESSDDVPDEDTTGSDAPEDSDSTENDDEDDDA